jgi:hypothetical protein
LLITIELQGAINGAMQGYESFVTHELGLTEHFSKKTGGMARVFAR